MIRYTCLRIVKPSLNYPLRIGEDVSVRFLNVGSNVVGLDQAGGLGHCVIETRINSCSLWGMRRGLCLLMVRPKSFKAGLVNQAFNCASH